jgi:hypothetical protein
MRGDPGAVDGFEETSDSLQAWGCDGFRTIDEEAQDGLMNGPG